MFISLLVIPFCKAADDESWNRAVGYNNIENQRALCLRFKRIDAIPAHLNLPQLQELDLDYNKITAIPHLNLPQLQELTLYYNEITAIPAHLNLPNLQKLNLHRNNKITVIENLNFPKLRELFLAYNEITTIPANLNLPQLQELVLYNNLITAISDNLNLPKLQRLYLHENHIEYVDPQILQQFPQLNYLNLNKNPLTQENVDKLREAAQQANRNIKIIADDIGEKYLPEGHYIKGD